MKLKRRNAPEFVVDHVPKKNSWKKIRGKWEWIIKRVIKQKWEGLRKNDKKLSRHWKKLVMFRHTKCSGLRLVSENWKDETEVNCWCLICCMENCEENCDSRRMKRTKHRTDELSEGLFWRVLRWIQKWVLKKFSAGGVRNKNEY